MDEPFYKYRVIDYFATGEGRSIWLMICPNNSPSYPVDYLQNRWEKFVNVEYYLYGTEELTEEEFMKKYGSLIPHHIKAQVHRRDQPVFTWQQHLHVNYS